MHQEQQRLPVWQQAIIDKCYHPIGVWEAFPEHALESSIPACFEAIVARYPERIAVVDQQRALTYAELNAAANQVAHGLVAHLGPGPEPVCHLCDFSIAGLVALLGVLKAGKFYVPLDNRWPVATLRQILALVETRLIVCDSPNQELTQQVAEGQVEAATLDDLALEVYQNLDVVVSPEDRQYIVFTSGSTGVPKGVVDIHRNALHVAERFINTYHICPQDRILLTHPWSFSGSQDGMFGALLSGATLYPYAIHDLGIDRLPEWIAEEALTVLFFTPPAFRLMAEGLHETESASSFFAGVRLIRCGGDRTLATDLEAYRRLMPDTAIFRIGFASSESKQSIQILYDKESSVGVQEVPIGWPFSELNILIVDETGNRLPPGATGEIVVHSRLVARGYWKQPELTSQKFRPDRERPGWVYYYTGDLGRVEADGCVYHLGRIDSQVKIRGQRVELIEIENALLSIDNIRNAVVALRGDEENDPRLVAWLVWDDPAQVLTVSDLRRCLAERLSSFMMPTHFVTVDHLPLSANGKVERRHLPDPDGCRPALSVDFVAPQTPLELELARIWADTLKIDRIGIHDNFLELGGDSIQAIQILRQLQELGATRMQLQALFEAPTIAQMTLVLLSHYVEEDQTNEL